MCVLKETYDRQTSVLMNISVNNIEYNMPLSFVEHGTIDKHTVFQYTKPLIIIHSCHTRNH